MELKLATKTEEKAINLTAHSGKNGISAYQVAVENGFDGSEAEWLESLKGEKGEKGDPGRELKASVIIASEESGVGEDSCDILYSDGDDFAETFLAASTLAKSIGVERIEILGGVYKAKTPVQMDIPEVVGVGNVEILQYYGEAYDEVVVRLGGEIVYMENITVGNSSVNYSTKEINCQEIHLNRVRLLGGFFTVNAKVFIENSVIKETFRIVNAKNSRVINCDIDILDAIDETKNCYFTGCRIGEIISMPEGNVLRDNTIGGEVMMPSVTERFMNVSFGRITTENSGDTIKRNIEPDSFEIYINEGKNMTVNLYTGTGSEPAKTLSSDVFIFISGNKGDDVVDGDKYQKTLILYLKSTLGVATLSKWIALSGSDVYSNVRIEITCPPNTYRGVMKNKKEAIYLNAQEV